MASRITIQNIADALGISRNTVSKAINNTGILADATREKVLKKAMELGYKQFSYATDASAPLFGLPLSHTEKKTAIALFTTDFYHLSHAACTMLDQFSKKLSQSGYSLTVHRLLADGQKSPCPPHAFAKDKTAGIACLGLCDPAYSRQVLSLALPTLFIDSPLAAFFEMPKADCLYADSQAGMFHFVREMLQRGKDKIGFIGDCSQSQSFLERYQSYRAALHLSGLSCPAKYCITDFYEALHTPPLAKKCHAISGRLLPKARAAS